MIQTLHPIPTRGLNEVLRRWTGPGELFEAVAFVEPDDLAPSHQSWRREDVERRANFILLKKLLTPLSRWPTRRSEWIDALPAVSSRQPRRLVDAPVAGMSWVETRQHGWPPKSFVVRPRQREADTLLVTMLRWTLDRLRVMREGALSLEKNADQHAREQLDVALNLLQLDVLRAAPAVRPTRLDVAAARREGRPWSQLAEVAEVLRHLDETSLSDLASELLMPDPEIQEKLFHLAVLGEVLLAITAMDGWTFRSVRPLARRSRRGPAYVVTSPSGSKWDLWFEAAAAWGYRGYGPVPSPYAEAASGVAGVGGAIGADLMLLRRPDRALVIECKYSDRTEYVGRQAYRQVMCYMLETQRFASKVDGLVVAPTGVIGSGGGFADIAGGRVGIVPPALVAETVVRVLGEGTDPA